MVDTEDAFPRFKHTSVERLGRGDFPPLQHSRQVHRCRQRVGVVGTQHPVACLQRASVQRFGPDAEYLPDRRLDYTVAESKRAAFGASVRRLVPDIQDDDLAPDISGIRPKLQGPKEGFRDFVIAEESARGLPGLVNLVGMDSPGLTSAPAIAEHVARLIEA